ncbi:MAG: hypothetical protein ABSD68_03495 [Candidatus Micrarchaeales archaeon]|jgi:hypothetical protein
MQTTNASSVRSDWYRNTSLGVRNYILERLIKDSRPIETLKSAEASLFVVSKQYTNSENACLYMQVPYYNLEFHIAQDYFQNYFQENKKEGASDLAVFLEKGFFKFVKTLKENENAVYDLAIKFWSFDPKVELAWSFAVASPMVSRYSRITFLGYDDKTGSALFYAAEPNPASAIKIVFKKTEEKATLREFFEGQAPKLRA